MAERGERIPTYHRILTTENKWLAGRYGLEAPIMDLATGKVRWTATSATFVTSNKFAAYDGKDRAIAFTPDNGRVLLSGIDLMARRQGTQTFMPVLRAFDASSGKLVADVQPGTRGLMAGRGDAIVIGGMRPVILDAKTLAKRASIKPVDRDVTAVAAHPTRDFFILSGDGGSTILVNASASAGEPLMPINPPHVRVPISGPRPACRK